MYVFRLVGLLPKLVTRVNPAAIAGAPDTSTTATTAASAAPAAIRERKTCFMSCPPTRGCHIRPYRRATGGLPQRRRLRFSRGAVDPVVWRRVLPPHHRIGSVQAEP